MKAPNRFLAAGIVGVVVTILANIFLKISNGMINLYFAGYLDVQILRVLFLSVYAVEIFVAMMICLVIYTKAIQKSKVKILRVLLFSLLAGLADGVLTFALPGNGDVFYYVMDILVTGLCALAVIGKMEGKEETVEVEQNAKACKAKGKYYPSFWVIACLGYVIFTATSVCVFGFINEWDYTVSGIAGLVLMNMVFSVVYTYLYFLPYLIANKKEHRQTKAIYILNIFAGWTFVAWLVALIWSFTTPSEQPAVQQTVSVSGADELMKYKNLLDEGVITQEEFDNKKQQLLQL